MSDGNIWVDPETGKPIERCPWLRQETGKNRFTCAIYYDRPDDCIFYPVTIAEMIQDECEMIEVKDMENLKKAQNTLDKLMADSRPSY